jgi:hypothetical protein
MRWFLFVAHPFSGYCLFYCLLALLRHSGTVLPHKVEMFTKRVSNYHSISQAFSVLTAQIRQNATHTSFPLARASITSMVGRFSPAPPPAPPPSPLLLPLGADAAAAEAD